MVKWPFQRLSDLQIGIEGSIWIIWLEKISGAATSSVRKSRGNTIHKVFPWFSFKNVNVFQQKSIKLFQYISFRDQTFRGTKYHFISEISIVLLPTIAIWRGLFPRGLKFQIVSHVGREINLYPQPCQCRWWKKSCTGSKVFYHTIDKSLFTRRGQVNVPDIEGASPPSRCRLRKKWIQKLAVSQPAHPGCIT